MGRKGPRAKKNSSEICGGIITRMQTCNFTYLLNKNQPVTEKEQKNWSWSILVVGLDYQSVVGSVQLQRWGHQSETV